MRKVWIAVVLLLGLTGCAEPPVYETMTDVLIPAWEPECRLVLELPEDAVQMVMGTEDAKIFLCDRYSIALQTMPGGDLNRTLFTLSGFAEDALTVMQTEEQGVKCYECVWSAAGESQPQMCRGLILDDGEYHYTVTVMAPADMAGGLSEDWQKLTESARLETIVNTDL